MTEYTYDLATLGQIAKDMKRISSEFPDIIKESMSQSIEINVHGPSIRTVPISDPNRYAPKRNGRRSWSNSYRPNQSGSLQKSYGLKIEFDSPSEMHATMFYDAKKLDSKGVERGYAKFVHDMPDPTKSGRPVQWSRPNSGNKFLEKYAEGNKDAFFADMIDFVKRRLFP